MFMLFFAEISIFARPPLKTRRRHLHDRKFFFSLAVFGYYSGLWRVRTGF